MIDNTGRDLVTTFLTERAKLTWIHVGWAGLGRWAIKIRGSIHGISCIFRCFLAFAASILYWLLGTNRYGSDRPGAKLQLTAREGATADTAMKPEPCRTIRVYFIKPSRYDEDGFVQYFRYGVQPNNTLTVMTALNEWRSTNVMRSSATSASKR